MNLQRFMKLSSQSHLLQATLVSSAVTLFAYSSSGTKMQKSNLQCIGRDVYQCRMDVKLSDGVLKQVNDSVYLGRTIFSSVTHDSDVVR